MQRTLLVLLALVSVAGLCAGAWFLLRDNPPVRVDPVLPAADDPVVADPGTRGASQPLAEPESTEGAGSADTSVVIPLEVELELVHASGSLQGPGVPAIGSGAKAQLKGMIRGSRGEPVRAQIEFVAGSNEGRILYCDGSGTFGAQDLYPGLSIVRVTGPGILGSEREVRLRQEREDLLNISYERPARVSGTVFDDEGKPLAGAEVSIDGLRTVSDELGRFEIPAVAAGRALAIVSKPGLAAYRELVDIMLGASAEGAHLQFRLQTSARLQVSVLDAINASEEAWLFILPSDGAAQRRFPWHTVNPVRVWPGGTATVEDLPSGLVSLRLFHAGAVAKPEHTTVLLGPHETTSAEFHLEPAPVVQGIVTDGGSPAPEARVVLEAPDRTAAMLSVFGQSNYLWLENDVFPNLPPAMQVVLTNGMGEFVLNANESASGVRYLSATSEDGKRRAQAVLQPGTTRVDLALAPVEDGSGEMRVVMEGRFQALPVRVTVDGAPRDLLMLPPGRDLSIGGLPRGSWLATVRWNGEALIQRAPVQIDEEVTLEVTLPEGAIFGQDADTIRRRGRQ